MRVITHINELKSSRLAVCIFVMHMVISSAAQDTVSLRPVEISATKIELSSTGQKTEILDSIQLAPYKSQNMSVLLSEQAAIHVKSYGPGAISTTAFRGGNASQTALLWNGINIQNYMLGQTDLSLLPVLLFDEVRIEYGSSSALWGSGAVGGSILMNSRSRFNEGLKVNVLASIGSFGLFNKAAGFNVGGKRLVAATKIYQQKSANKYLYATDGSKQNHAAYELNGLMQEFHWMISSKNILNVNAWISQNSRQIALSGAQLQGAVQYDNSARIVSQYMRQGKRILSQFRAAYLDETINYNDSSVLQYTHNRVKTALFEADESTRWKKHFFHAGINLSSSEASSDNYKSVKSLNRMAALAGARFNVVQNRLVIQANLRMEYFSAASIPFTWNLSGAWEPVRRWLLKLNAASVFRQPTFNELFWQPGGNPQLKPEQGYSFEGTASYHFYKSRLGFSLSGSAYSRTIDDWILWVPGPSAQPTPLNLNKVWSRGTETEWELGYTFDRWKIKFNLRTAYVLSTQLSSGFAESDAIGRQLIYTPRYSGNAGLQFFYTRYRLIFQSQYTGYRFTSSDNRQWLEPYQVYNVRFTASFLKQQLTMFAICNNLLNKPYTVVIARPMPLRNFEIGLNWQFINKKLKPKNQP